MSSVWYTSQREQTDNNSNILLHDIFQERKGIIKVKLGSLWLLSQVNQNVLIMNINLIEHTIFYLFLGINSMASGWSDLAQY